MSLARPAGAGGPQPGVRGGVQRRMGKAGMEHSRDSAAQQRPRHGLRAKQDTGLVCTGMPSLAAPPPTARLP